MPDKVLIADDDTAICKMLQKVMTSNQLDSDVVNCGHDVLSAVRKNTYSVIILDINLGDMEGFDIIKEMRADGVTTPVMIISGRSEDYDALYGLSVGADDYITKPFRPVVLGAKVMALLRRSHSESSAASASIVRGIFRYDTSSMRFYKNEKEVVLSAKENSLMLLFMQNPDQIFTKEMIYDHVWNNTVIVDDNAIMVYINRLRNKIEDDPQKPKYIMTVRGMGYRFRAQTENGES